MRVGARARRASSCDLAICGVSFRPSSLPGAAFTRFQTLRLQKIFPRCWRSSLSATAAASSHPGVRGWRGSKPFRRLC